MQKVITWVVRGIGFLIALLILMGFISFAVSLFYLPGKVPSVEDAPWAIQTYSNDSMRVPSRFYFSKQITQEEGDPVITGYWSFDGKKYHYHRGKKAFPIDLYGSIDIIKRENNVLQPDS